MPRETKLDMTKDSSVEVEMIFGTPNSKKITVNVVNKDRHVGRVIVFLRVSENPADSNIIHKDFQPLLDPNRKRQKPPLAGSENGDLDDGRVHDGSYPGQDDGMLEPEPKKHEGHDLEDGGDSDRENELATHDDGTGAEDGYRINNRFEVDDGPMAAPMVIPDLNTYQQRKNLAQGMMDLALFTANVNQLHYVVETSMNHPYFYFNMACIVLSLLLQVAVAVGLILNSRYDFNQNKDIFKANKVNNRTVLGIFLVTVVNVFIASFSVEPSNLTAGILPLLQYAASNITRKNNDTK